MLCTHTSHLISRRYIEIMRIALILALMPLPCLAWEFSPDPICTLIHQSDMAEIAVTYDARLPEYALFITLRDGVWADASTFQLIFGGGIGGAIGTTQQTISTDGATLTVRDSGFDNVLDGLEFNRRMGVLTDAQMLFEVLLDDAAPAVQAFRACPDDTPALS